MTLGILPVGELRPNTVTTVYLWHTGCTTHPPGRLVEDDTMSTLARDFGAEFPDGREAWIEANLDIWLRERVAKCDQPLARLEIEMARAEWPTLVHHSDWAAIRNAGRSLRLLRSTGGR